jgi:hypothetical protein
MFDLQMLWCYGNVSTTSFDFQNLAEKAPWWKTFPIRT